MSQGRPEALDRADEPEAGDSAVLGEFAGARGLDDGIGTAGLTYHELRDVLWLSGKLRPPENLRETAEPAAPTPLTEPAADVPETDVADTGDDAEEEVDEEPEPEPDPLGHTAFASLVVRSEAGPLVLPTLPALPDARGIAHALRPFMRKTPSPWRTVLDEEGTAVRAAQDGLWLPEWQPAPWRRFDVALVTDIGSSMDIWRRTAREFLGLLRRQGAFRDVRHYQLDCSKESPDDLLLEVGAAGKAWHWSRLVEPTGRRLVLVLTDAIGPAWHSGAAAGLLARWGRTMPVAVVQVLEHRLWHWSALTTRRVRMSARRSGAANRHLKVRAVQPDAEITPEELKNAVPVPVLGLSPDWMAGWAKLLTSDDGGWVETTATLVSPVADDITVAPPNGRAGLLSARDRVLRFRTHASVEAFSLAGLLAAAPLSLPLMTLVQRKLLPGSSLSTLAEVMLGGLLKQVVPVVPPPTSRAEENAPKITYDFHDGVRDELLGTVRRSDTVRVAMVLGEHAGDTHPALRNLRDAIAAPDEADDPEQTDENRPYLRVQEAVLRALSGPYARRARRLANARIEVESASSPSDAIVEEAAASEPAAHAEHTTGEGDVIPLAVSLGQGREPTGQPSIWGPVPLRNPNFVGRQAVLETLRARLLEPGTAAVLPEALHGMGGIGKTQTVIEYIYRHAGEYDLVWWISAEHPAQIRASFVELAKRLGLPVGSAETAIPAVLEALRTGKPHAGWILVFDNADRLDEVRPFFPAGNGHVVVTSRNPEWATVARQIAVDLFTRAESIELLQRRDPTIADSDADRLAAALGDLPLAVEQAAAWRSQTGMPVSEYLELFEQHRMELLDASTPVDYEISVAAAWNVPLHRLRTDHPAALQLLQVCAFFSPEPIPRSWFNGVRNVPVPDELTEAFRDPIRLHRAVREINRYSLAKIDHRSNTLQLHRLVQMVLRSHLDTAEQDQLRHAVHVLLAHADPGDPEAQRNWSTYADLLPHATASRAAECKDRWVRVLMSNLVRYLLASGDDRGALGLSEEVLSHSAESDIEKIDMARLHAIALRRLDRGDEAMRLNERNLELVREVVGEDHEMWLSMLDTVAADRRTHGKFAEALALQQTVYDRSCEILGEDDPSTLQHAHNLATCHRLMGDFVKARSLDAETLRRTRAVLGEDHPFTYLSVTALAVDLRECGDHEGARSQLQETLPRQRELLGEYHPYTIGAARNLAVTLRMLGDHAGALELSKECVIAYGRRHGNWHIDTVTALSNVSVDYRHAGELHLALEPASDGYDQFRRIRGSGHPYTLIAAMNLASVHRSLGALQQARELDEVAVSSLRAALGSDHPFALAAATNLASDLAALRVQVRSRALNEDLLERSARVLGEEHPSTLAIALNLSLDLRQDGADAEAESLHTRTVASFLQVLGADHPATIAAGQHVRAICDVDTMEL
ncbi:FxSxx-COOH system tetratricopeptide repeat protein [Lentzea sp. BCCO 10_0856]|uniref:FxSxx-COOH system tetratricopeptide repeat protein n=1 Tax=Lentzea miocenica TaxID=3095431 RepID=A0ABU4STJ6_9PSEU|nr:FxSxx-COOH system tetratricopeptide repeat protein [Lentzea sp. BCCO 10_0856]MDX8029223.1 FxSxx-COOH system tetratricopeptide repeat protein [Lentzea sp. BCCO 10_0856]